MRRLALAATVVLALGLAGLTTVAHGTLAQNGTNGSSTDGSTPQAGAFTVSCEELRCTFDASDAEMTNGSISMYRWSFGDGGTGDGATVEHRYPDVGTYNVTLTLQSMDGETENHTRVLEVTAERHGNQGVVPWTALAVGGAALVGSILLSRLT